MQAERVPYLGDCWGVRTNSLSGTDALGCLSDELRDYVFDSPVKPYLLLLQKSVEEGNAIVKLTSRLYIRDYRAAEFYTRKTRVWGEP